MLTLKLFGAPVLESAGVPITGRAAQGHRLAILAVLALAGGRPVGRDRLVALLWPESSAERARPQLSDALYVLRGGAGADVVRTVGDDLLLHADVRSDVGDFERMLDAGEHEQAVALVTGPLLDGFHLAGSVEFERWLDAERVRIAGHHASALEALADACERRGDPAAAAGWWRRLAALDPCDGRVALRLMRALDAAGDPAGALRHARVHSALLREEFDTAPTHELTSFAEQLRTPPRARDESPATTPSITLTVSPPAGDALRPDVGLVDPGLATSLDRSPGGDAPAGSATPVAAPIPPTPRRRRFVGRTLGAAALLGVVVVGALGAFFARRGDASGGRSQAAPAVRPARSLAVLPFANRSPDPANGYFSDGLSEEIITALSRVTGLRVAARTSSFALRDAALDVRLIGDTLNVETVLEGSVRREGNRLRVTAQLVDASSGLLLWSGEYDRDAADALAVQDDIARSIARALELRLPTPATTTRAGSTPGLEAYDLYLRALHLRSELDADALRQASALLDRAIALEPGFALAHAAQASVIAPRMFYGDLPLEQGTRDMRASVSRAFALDSTVGEAHVALGILRLFFEWDWAGAERSLRRAIALNPNDPHAWHHLANQQRAVGRIPEAVDAFAHALTLDPLNARTRVVYAYDLARLGRMDEALAEAERAQALDPMQPVLLGRGPNIPLMGWLHQLRGDSASAVQALMRVAALRGASAPDIDALRGAFARGGMPAVWRQWQIMDSREPGTAKGPLHVALLHALAGDTATAMDWIERAHAVRDPGMTHVNALSIFTGIHGHPRFRRIVAAMRLPTP